MDTTQPSTFVRRYCSNSRCSDVSSRSFSVQTLMRPSLSPVASVASSPVMRQAMARTLSVFFASLCVTLIVFPRSHTFMSAASPAKATAPPPTNAQQLTQSSNCSGGAASDPPAISRRWTLLYMATATRAPPSATARAVIARCCASSGSVRHTSPFPSGSNNLSTPAPSATINPAGSSTNTQAAIPLSEPGAASWAKALA
mmetsp:Transcript_18544/g.48417  ORF Transcript_18544/g.48417 Transcript_18544/m.48417 type:complete len:200 (-) Transcript_18544:2717-3316(-)